MAEGKPRYRTGKLCYIEIPAWFTDPAGNVLGVCQQPGLAETEQAATEASRG
jgi:hypothetical protein